MLAMQHVVDICVCGGTRLTPPFVKLSQALLDNLFMAVVVLGACGHFSITLLPSSQLSMNIL